MSNEVFSLCFMCSIRCPIKVSVESGQVKWIEGNPHVSKTFMKAIDSPTCCFDKGLSDNVIQEMIRQGWRQPSTS
ncbi:MAG: hypothetical protein HY881_24890 [Deltaproteobacteria bacterium]|nr:hypothetical protein [Deltaproteobacteria bacterium]